MHKKVLDVALFAIFLAGSSCWKYALAQAVLHEQNKDNLEFSHSTADSMFTERPLDMAASFLHSQRVLNPVQLFQGINPGLSVVRPGGNVFEGFRVRGRGLMSFETHNNEPLYIIDGMPVFHMDMLDPFWVSSISSDLDAFSSVRYGLRGNRPVLSFNSKSAPILKELTVDFETRLSSESIGRRIPIADRQTFLNFGGDDLGADTDWMEEVSRTGFSQEYNLDLSYQNKTSVLRLSGTYRNINPVLKTTNGKWLNGHVSYRFQDRKERLNIGLRSWLHHRENEYGFPEAFHFARVYNPSAPIRDSQSDRFDGYYQRIQFNYYNPVAMLEQNSLGGTNSGGLYMADATFKLTNHLSVFGKAGVQDFSSNAQLKISRYSFYRPNVHDVETEAINHEENTTQSRWWNGGLTFSQQWDKVKLSLESGYEWHNWEEKVQLTYLPEGERLQEGLSYVVDSKIINWYGEIDLAYQDAFFVGYRVNRSGSDRLSQKNRWGNFFGIRVGSELTEFINLPFLNQLKLTLGYAEVGNSLSSGNLADYVLVPNQSFLYDNQIVNSYTYQYDRNPDLSWEERREWELGVRTTLAGGRVDVNMNWFWNRSDKLIYNDHIPSPPSLTGRIWGNFGEIRNKGWEMDMGVRLIDKPTFVFDSRLGFYGWNSVLEEATFFERIIGGGCGCGSRFSPLFLFRGNEIGELYAPDISFNQSQQEYVIVDRNNNGYGDMFDDDYVIGSAVPSLNLSWQNQITWNQWTVQLGFRGSFGHHIIDESRMHFEYKNVVSSYNAVVSDFFELNNAPYMLFGARHVQMANFMNLDHFYLSYKFRGSQTFFENLEVYLGGRNVLTMSNYQSGDPEVRWDLDTYSPIRQFSSTRDFSAVAPGWGSERIYPHTRIWFLGFKCSL